MHYMNGREAKYGDPVIGKNAMGAFVCGVLHNLQPQAMTCNVNLAYVVPGKDENATVTVGECIHAHDAYQSSLDHLPQAPATKMPQVCGSKSIGG